jgi:hypothetical protein
MSTRADLLAVAEGLAAEAKAMLAPQPSGIGELHYGPDPAKASELAGSAKVALEAAALAQDIAPAEHTAALKSILYAFGIDWDEAHDPTELAAMAVEHLKRCAKVWKQVAAHKDAHDVLRDFAAAMERDWLAADSEASRRLAARARAALDEAAQLLATE